MLILHHRMLDESIEGTSDTLTINNILCALTHFHRLGEGDIFNVPAPRTINTMQQ